REKSRRSGRRSACVQLRGREDATLARNRRGKLMKSMHLAVAAAAALLMATPAHAQRVNTGATGTFGQVQLRAGFMPDPHAVTVSAGGGIEAVSVDDDCFA